MCDFNGRTVAVQVHTILIALSPVSFQSDSTSLTPNCYSYRTAYLKWYLRSTLSTRFSGRELNDVLFRLLIRRLTALPLVETGLLQLFNLQIWSGVAIQF